MCIRDRYASRASVGFNGNVRRGEAMLAQVKKTFKPEFINRLSDMVVFNDMDKHMAEDVYKRQTLPYRFLQGEHQR